MYTFSKNRHCLTRRRDSTSFTARARKTRELKESTTLAIFSRNPNLMHRVGALGPTESLRLLAEADDIYIDGTFRTCPRLFYQIFTIHAFFHSSRTWRTLGLPECFPSTCGMSTWPRDHTLTTTSKVGTII